MAEKNYGNNSQLAELVKYISDTMKFPVMGAGGGFAPIGTINFFDATTAPLGWLACDGSIHNISDYPDLATFYASQHGASNYYGGNGTTTFAVPNLQGEFLRGAGTNGHTNQGSGGSVGEHQDATQHTYSYTEPSNGALIYGVGAKNMTDLDTIVGGVGYNAFNGTIQQGSNINKFYTSRPTNTSFLICVKATVSGDANAHQYSTEEQVVGMDENGNTVYERTFIGTADTQDGYYIVSDATLRNIVMISGKVKHKTIQSYEYIMPYIYTSSPTTEYAYLLINEGAGVQLYSKGDSYGGQYRVVLQYTKSS